MIQKVRSNPNLKNKDGYSSLHIALWAKHEDMALFLLDRGADAELETTTQQIWVSWLATSGIETPLMIAVQNNLFACVKRILLRTRNINHTLVLKSFSIAIERNFTEIVDEFLQYTFNLNNTVYKDKSPLIIAIESSFQISQILISRRDVDVNL